MRAVGTHITDVNASSHSWHHLFLQDETTMESQLEARVTDAWAAQQQSQKKQWERRAGPVKNTIHGSDFSFIRMEKIHPSVSGTLPFLFTQSCPTLSNTMDCSPPGSCVHEISKARILEWVAISSSRGLSQPRDRTQISCVSWIAGRFFTTEPGKPNSCKARFNNYQITNVLQITFYEFNVIKSKGSNLEVSKGENLASLVAQQ